MRKAIGFLLGITLLITISGCARTMSWQGQYDLGVRYLSEGNYEEAIIAFTAAIEIDPKQATAYVGRGDAYVGQAASPVAQVADDSYNSAATDYLVAIDLDPLAAEVYEKLGRVYIEQGDYDAAADILERGYEATKDERLLGVFELLRIEGPVAAALESIEMLRAGLEGPVTVTGCIIDNIDEYGDTWNAFRGQNGEWSTHIVYCITSFGIRFDSPQKVITESGIEYIKEAQAGGGLDREVLESLVGHTVKFTGSLYFDGEEEFSGPYAPGTYFEDEFTHYLYNPNGPWQFRFDSYVIVE